MKPIILSKHPIFADALIRSMNLCYPTHEQPSVFYFDEIYTDGYNKLSSEHNLNICNHVAYLPVILEAEARLTNEVLIMKDTTLFIRPFNTEDNKSLHQFRINQNIFSYYLYMDKDTYDSPQTNVYNWKNESSSYRFDKSHSATIFRSSDIINYGMFFKRTGDTIYLTSSYDIEPYRTNRIIDDKRSVLEYTSIIESNLNEEFIKGKVINYHEFLYLETEEIVYNIPHFNLSWR